MQNEHSKHIFRKIMLTFLSLILLIIAAAAIILQHPAFGRRPTEAERIRLQKSPNYHDGRFHNREEKPMMMPGSNSIFTMLKFIFSKPENLSPKEALPVASPNLLNLDRKENTAVWLGHSSYFIQIEGKRFLVDPVLTSEFPVSIMMKPFAGTNKITPDSIPEIDFLIITHDHWDHLDYGTFRRMKSRIGKVICPLGVGEYFRGWGFPDDRIIELDWDESTEIGENFVVNCLSSHHFSNRLINRNQTLWASFLLQSPKRKIYIGGDGGYDSRFREVYSKFGSPDFAFMENGQYNQQWHYVHLMPEELVIAVNELKPKRFMTVHNSKFALGRHTWQEPMEKFRQLPCVIP